MFEMQVALKPLNELGLGAPPKRVGILGGTFNPVHNGHLDCAQHALIEFGLSQVLFLVSGDPAYKPREEIAPGQARLDMVELATLAYPVFTPSDLELRRTGHTYTIDTMRILRDKDPETEYLYIIGEDSLYELPTWKDFAHLARMTEFICIRRPGTGEGRRPQEMAARLQERYDAVIHLADFTGPEISSTMIRRRVRDGESIKGLVPPAVEDYIYATGLYV